MARSATNCSIIVASLITTFASAAALAADASLEVHLSFRDGATLCREGRLTASADGQNPVTRPFTRTDTRIALALQSGIPWQIELQGEGCWAGRQMWRDAGRLEIAVYGAGKVHGRFAGRLENVKDISGTIYWGPAPSQSIEPGSGEELSCELHLPDWQCSVPAGRPFDLRLATSGHAPLHFWDLNVRAAGVVELGAHDLRAGASVAGWIEQPDGSPLEAAHVAVAPLTAAPPALRRAADVHATETSKRGFFQIAGLAAGQYEVSSVAPGLSPVESAVELREGEAVVLPHPLRHVALARLEVILTPELDPKGKPWRIELRTDRVQQRDVTAGNSELGRWASAPLPAKTYAGTVRDQAGNAFARFVADLTAGDAVVPLIIKAIPIRGRLLLGERGIEATVVFARDEGEHTAAQTDADGDFETSFPAAGAWEASATIPRKPARPAIIKIGRVDIPEDQGDDRLLLQIGGGQISGTVMAKDGTPVRAAVRVRRGHEIIAQQITETDATFDFIAIRPGVYAIEAQGDETATPVPIAVTVGKDESVEINVVVEALRRLKGSIRTPYGQPASGAAVRISHDGGFSWYNATADQRGMFTALIPSGPDVVIGVSTYAYPSTVLRVPAGDNAPTISLRPEGGVLRVLTDGKTPCVLINGILTGLSMLWYPEPFGRFDGGIFLPPGEYVACPERALDARCRKASILPGVDAQIDLRSVESGK